MPRRPIVLPAFLVAVGLALAAGGFYVGQTDDAPGAALIGIALLVCSVGAGGLDRPAIADAVTLAAPSPQPESDKRSSCVVLRSA